MSCAEQKRTANSPHTDLIVSDISSTSYTTTAEQIRRKTHHKHTQTHTSKHASEFRAHAVKHFLNKSSRYDPYIILTN